MINFNSVEYDNPNKHYVKVNAEFDTDGKITPAAIYYDDEYREVDRICDIRPAASLKSGGAGIRYTCYIQGVKTYLFLEENRWFFEPCL